MIPNFPKFKKLEILDLATISKKTATFPPYSDFYFFSLWSNDVKNNIEISILNDNLVVKFIHYSQSHSFFSFLGNNQVLDSIDALITLSEMRQMPPRLSLIPEVNFVGINRALLNLEYSVQEDPDNHDYILSIEALATMKGPKLHQKRKSLNNFLRRYNGRAVLGDINKPSVKLEILTLLKLWQSKKTNAVNLSEIAAIEKVLQYASDFKPFLMLVYINNQLKSFTIYERVNKDYSINSFQKADPEYYGIYEFSNYSIANHLKGLGCKYMNIEQDLGVPGLRQAKLSYRPEFFLKKYIISRKTALLEEDKIKAGQDYHDRDKL